MTPERREILIGHLKAQLGLPQAWRIVGYSAVGLVLVLAVLGILTSVVLSGAEGSDDIGVPLAITALLAPICAMGLVVGVTRVRSVERMEIVVALREPQPPVLRVDRSVDAWGPVLSIHLRSGAEYAFRLDAALGDEIADWLSPQR